jgi:hypothetical protein
MANEYIVLAKNLNTSYSDFLLMPTYLRKYIIGKLNEGNSQNS